ncbi:MAG: o-succinylbenzoate synthase [Ginsengibacter sp.]
MLKCSYQKYTLRFIRPGGTSRGILYEKETWIISLYDDTDTGKVAYGECGLFKGLSFDGKPGYEEKLSQICEQLPTQKQSVLSQLNEWPSIYFGIEMVLKDWENNCNHVLFDNEFTQGEKGIDINGLIWMDNKESMISQMETKFEQGFTCIKMKIGAIDFESELGILQLIRGQFSSEQIEIRVDANGAFSVKEALEKLKRLSDFDIHSIEQPIRQGQIPEMAELIKTSPIPIALDEELIGITDIGDKRELLEKLQPLYIILKPTLVGGFAGSQEWIDLIEEQAGQWWITSALESNVGLNAIAQFASTKNNALTQGLGTGQLYSNNFDSPLQIQNGKLFFDKTLSWNFSNLKK